VLLPSNMCHKTTVLRLLYLVMGGQGGKGRRWGGRKGKAGGEGKESREEIYLPHGRFKTLAALCNKYHRSRPITVARTLSKKKEK